MGTGSDLTSMFVTNVKNVFQTENKFYHLNKTRKSSNGFSTEHTFAIFLKSYICSFVQSKC